MLGRASSRERWILARLDSTARSLAENWRLRDRSSAAANALTPHVRALLRLVRRGGQAEILVEDADVRATRSPPSSRSARAAASGDARM